MEIKKMKIKDLKPAPYNPRVDITPSDSAYQKIKRNIEEFGLVEPIIWNKKTGYIVGGHQRLKVLSDMGEKEVEVSIVNITKEKEKVLNIALNKISNDWDNNKLSELLSTMEIDEQMLSGFESYEISALLSGASEEELKPNLEEFDFEAGNNVEESGISYVVYLSFGSKKSAEKWLSEKGFEEKFKKNATKLVIRAENYVEGE